jgi:hypothetical protein
MGVVEDLRQDFAPEMREIRCQLASMGQRMDAMEEVHRIRFESIVQRLETIQQSFAFDKRISDLEADKRRSA